ncbi:MAG: hypothetical protein RLZZ405_163 [Verrucomicrobiota bacterium]|jgi:hypothetical protein
MTALLPYLLVDAVVLIGAVVLLGSRLSFWHPATTYLLFHAYSFSVRAWQLYDGASPMYAENGAFDVIRPEEFQRALLFADAALVVFVVAAYFAHLRFEAAAHEPIARRRINRTAVLTVAGVCLPVGFYIFLTSKAGAVTTNAFTETNYYQVMAMWPIGCLGLLIYLRGFRWYLLLPTAVYLALVAVQGYHRFMLVLPLLFLASYYLQARRRRWPGLPILFAAALVFLVLPRLKAIGQAVQVGDFNEAVQLVGDSFRSTKGLEGSSSEQFLDQFAGALTMTDDYGKVYYGSTYLAIVTLPIPRSLWPAKPGLGDHTIEISTARRQYDREGRIITYIGESYLNFRHLGVLLVPGLLGFLLTRWCLRATSGPLHRFESYLYTVFAMAYIQLFRDGLLSIFVFTVVHNMPMLFAWILHTIPGFVQRVIDPPPAHPLAQEDLTLGPPPGSFPGAPPPR